MGSSLAAEEFEHVKPVAVAAAELLRRRGQPNAPDAAVLAIDADPTNPNVDAHLIMLQVIDDQVVVFDPELERWLGGPTTLSKWAEEQQESRVLEARQHGEQRYGPVQHARRVLLRTDRETGGFIPVEPVGSHPQDPDLPVHKRIRGVPGGSRGSGEDRREIPGSPDSGSEPPDHGGGHQQVWQELVTAFSAPDSAKSTISETMVSVPGLAMSAIVVVGPTAMAAALGEGSLDTVFVSVPDRVYEGLLNKGWTEVDGGGRTNGRVVATSGWRGVSHSELQSQGWTTGGKPGLRVACLPHAENADVLRQVLLDPATRPLPPKLWNPERKAVQAALAEHLTGKELNAPETRRAIHLAANGMHIVRTLQGTYHNGVGLEEAATSIVRQCVLAGIPTTEMLRAVIAEVYGDLAFGSGGRGGAPTRPDALPSALDHDELLPAELVQAHAVFLGFSTEEAEALHRAVLVAGARVLPDGEPAEQPATQTVETRGADGPGDRDALQELPDSGAEEHGRRDRSPVTPGSPRSLMLAEFERMEHAAPEKFADCVRVLSSRYPHYAQFLAAYRRTDLTLTQAAELVGVPWTQMDGWIPGFQKRWALLWSDEAPSTKNVLDTIEWLDRCDHGRLVQRERELCEVDLDSVQALYLSYHHSYPRSRAAQELSVRGERVTPKQATALVAAGVRYVQQHWADPVPSEEVDVHCVRNSLAARNATYPDAVVPELGADEDPEKGAEVQALSWLAKAHNEFLETGFKGRWVVAARLDAPRKGMWVVETLTSGRGHARFVWRNDDNELVEVKLKEGKRVEEPYDPGVFDPAVLYLHGIAWKPDGKPVYELSTDFETLTIPPPLFDGRRPPRPPAFVSGTGAGDGEDRPAAETPRPEADSGESAEPSGRFVPGDEESIQGGFNDVVFGVWVTADGQEVPAVCKVLRAGGLQTSDLYGSLLPEPEATAAAQATGLTPKLLGRYGQHGVYEYFGPPWRHPERGEVTTSKVRAMVIDVLCALARVAVPEQLIEQQQRIVAANYGPGIENPLQLLHASTFVLIERVWSTLPETARALGLPDAVQARQRMPSAPGGPSKRGWHLNHNDLGPGNILLHGARGEVRDIRAIDLGIATIGDPLEDLIRHLELMDDYIDILPHSRADFVEPGTPLTAYELNLLKKWAGALRIPFDEELVVDYQSIRAMVLL
ncbi:MAG: phosphotransferase, partial [Mycobacterium sp.]|nr:phosphotransferase [Mycobacterium sp.]